MGHTKIKKLDITAFFIIYIKNLLNNPFLDTINVSRETFIHITKTTRNKPCGLCSGSQIRKWV